MSLRQRFKDVRKDFGQKSRFVVSSQVWYNTIPTRDCDILLTFPAGTEDSTLMWLLTRIRARIPELGVTVRQHSTTGVCGFYLTTKQQSLLKLAEEMCLRKPLKPEYGGGLKEFILQDKNYFLDADSSQFFCSEERQVMVRQMLSNLRADVGDNILGIQFRPGQRIVPTLISQKVASQVFPLHHHEDLTRLQQSWVRAFFRSQPLDHICDYFGVKIAIYFAYLGHYTKALILPTILGLVIWAFKDYSLYLDDVCFVLFALINVFWSTLYLEHWKRCSSEFSYKWGTLDEADDLLAEPRPLFYGELVKSNVTGRQEPHYSAWKRNVFRYFVSLPVIMLCLLVVLGTVLTIFTIQDWVNVQIAEGKFYSVCKFLPKVLLALCIGVLDWIYKKIALWLNKKENYRDEEAYQNHMIVKLVLFQSVNSFLSLFYIAFYLQDMDRLRSQLAALLITRQVVGNVKEAVLPYALEKAKLFRMGYNMTRSSFPVRRPRSRGGSAPVADGLARQDRGAVEDLPSGTITAPRPDFLEAPTRDVGGREGECLEKLGEESPPYASASEKSPKHELVINQTSAMWDVDSPRGMKLTQAEVEAAMKKYEDTFEDHLEMYIQFGYVTLFSSAFPLAALCALLNNVIEIRSDAFKLCMSLQRPFGQRVSGIGKWQDCLELMSVVAVMVNCALIGMSGLADRWLPNMNTATRIVFIVVLEHVILLLKLVIAYSIPDVPFWVAEEKARLDFLRRDALKRQMSFSPRKFDRRRSFLRLRLYEPARVQPQRPSPGGRRDDEAADPARCSTSDSDLSGEESKPAGPTALYLRRERTAGERTAGERTAGERTAGERTAGERTRRGHTTKDRTSSARRPSLEQLFGRDACSGRDRPATVCRERSADATGRRPSWNHSFVNCNSLLLRQSRSPSSRVAVAAETAADSPPNGQLEQRYCGNPPRSVFASSWRK